PTEADSRSQAVHGAGFPPGPIAGFQFDAQTTEAIWQCIQSEIARLVKEHGGLRPFQVPRSTADAPETGHVIVSAHDGIALASVDISWHVINGQQAWGGYTKWARLYPPEMMLTDPATSRLSNREISRRTGDDHHYVAWFRVASTAL